MIIIPLISDKEKYNKAAQLIELANKEYKDVYITCFNTGKLIDMSDKEIEKSFKNYISLVCSVQKDISNEKITTLLSNKLYDDLGDRLRNIFRNIDLSIDVVREEELN